MGSVPSRSFPTQPSPAFSCDDLFSRDEYHQQARHILSRLHIVPPLQRRRARSVGLDNESGTFWVYWRPGRGKENKRPSKVELNVDVQPSQEEVNGELI